MGVEGGTEPGEWSRGNKQETTVDSSQLKTWVLSFWRHTLHPQKDTYQNTPTLETTHGETQEHQRQRGRLKATREKRQILYSYLVNRLLVGNKSQWPQNSIYDL